MELAEFLEKVILGEKEVTRITSFEEKLIVKLFNFKNLAKISGKKFSSNIEDA